MDLELSDKIALITGSSSGLGLCIARTLHNEGCHIILNGRCRRRLAAAATEFSERIDRILGDVTSPDNASEIVRKIKRKYNRLDVLICNVGSGSSVAPGLETPDEWRRMFDLNFFSATNIIEHARPIMRVHGGNIVCISSICGIEILGAPLTYSCAKASLNHYIKGCSRPFAKDGIRINAVAPGNLLFPGSVWDNNLKEQPDTVKTMLEKEVSLSRLGKPEEVSRLVSFLASPTSSFCTGAVFTSDGGQLRS
ncbi:MAG: oxidoreductase [Flavobacteriaceae bacterium]|nr:oxidoreductase [Flavobacteriaceae bacterium]